MTSEAKKYLQQRRVELKKKLEPYDALRQELKEVEAALAALENAEPKKTCNGCYYVPLDSRDGPPTGGCDICRQGPYYR